jgi:malate dehydrogenase (oxaloacetate-decarboxylating)(NADP+)
MGVDLSGAEIVFAAEEDDPRERYAQNLYEKRMRKGLTINEARSNMFKPIYYAAAMVEAGDAEAMVAGIDSNYPEIVRPALEVIGTAEGVGRVAGLYMVAFPYRDLLFLADTTVNIDPDAAALADIAQLSARFVKELGLTPRIAMISFSNFGSARHPESLKVAEAVKIIRGRDPDLEVDGEMQADTAVDLKKLKEEYPFSVLKQPANILVFSNLTAANASYKLLHRLGGAELIGPILLGMSRPVHILQRGTTGQDVLNLATIASVDAQARASRALGSEL